MKHGLSATSVLVACGTQRDAHSTDSGLRDQISRVRNTNAELARIALSFRMTRQEAVLTLVYLRHWLHNLLLTQRGEGADVMAVRFLAKWIEGIPEVLFRVDSRVLDWVQAKVDATPPLFLASRGMDAGKVMAAVVRPFGAPRCAPIASAARRRDGDAKTIDSDAMDFRCVQHDGRATKRHKAGGKNRVAGALAPAEPAKPGQNGHGAARSPH